MFSTARRHACTLTLAFALPALADLETQLASGDFVAAEKSLEALAHDWESSAKTPADLIEWARTLHALGSIERRILDSEDAETHLAQALALFENHAPEEAPDTREALALAKQDRGKLRQAEALFRKNLSIAHPRTSSHLGLLLLQLGEYQEAGVQLTKALKKCPENDPLELARRNADLGRYWHTLGSHARALGHFETGLDLLAESASNNELAISLTSQKALAMLRLGETESANSSFLRAADMARQAFADRPLEAIPHISNLGILALASDDPESARNHFEEALALLDSNGLSEHPASITLLNNLGIAQLELGSYEQAFETLVKARELQRKHLPAIHLRVAETERNIAAASMMMDGIDTSERVSSANRIGLELLDQLLGHGSEIERLNFLQRIDLLSLSCTVGDSETIANMLLASKARLLDQLIQPSAQKPAPDWRDVQKVLPHDAVLLDFCRYTPPNDETHYGAILLAAEGKPRWIPLATEARVESWLSILQTRLEWKAAALAGEESRPPPFHLPGILSELHDCVFAPLVQHLSNDCRQLIFAPEGILHAIPFAALRNSDGRYLCQTYDLGVQIDSGREFLASLPTRKLDDHPWLVAGVSKFPSRDHSDPDPLTRILHDPTPLPGTRNEVHRIRKLSPKGSARRLEVSEQEIRNLHFSPRVFHLSTHSFFLDEEKPSTFPHDFDRSAGRLFASGILLHRAAERDPGLDLLSPSDDLLFPREIASLPLAETRLVTLSSCQSGIGTAVQGEGILGLRRAFALAGTREVVTALWPVSDKGSPEFMERFYQLTLSTGNPSQALWQTQDEFLTSTDDPEAAILFNAPFILAQRGPLLPLGEITEPKKAFPWSWLLALTPLGIFLIARVSGRNPKIDQR